MKKQKRFELKDVKVGMKAVVNDLVDTSIYEVKSITGFQVALVYQSGGQEVSGGSIDYSVLREPSKEQLAYDEAYQARQVKS